MSHSAWIGNTTLILGLASVALSFFASLFAHRRGQLRRVANRAVFLSAALFTLGSAVMIHAFIQQDHTLLYVFRYSDAKMPWIYQLAAFWGGQAGSLYFWAAALSWFGAAVVWRHRQHDAPLLPVVNAVIAGVLLFFTLLLIFVSNPFESFELVEAPANGQGLNPQLQTWAMVAHPPALLLGYIAATVPFAFSVAALVTGRLDNAWLRASRKWTLLAWVFLTIGLLLGMWWAYTELGWGGYWAWDPVENAALIPWFVMTAFLHSAIVQEKRGMLKRWNMVLIHFTWLLTIFGTFLTRSGLISSVHAFARSSIGDYFLYFMVAALGFSIALISLRWGALRGERQLKEVVSREAAFLVGNWALLLAAAFVLIGTVLPKVMEMVDGRQMALDPPWFNKWMGPIAFLITALTGIGILLTWGRQRSERLARVFVKPLLIAGAVTGTLPFVYFNLRVDPFGFESRVRDGIYALIGLFVFTFLTTAVLQELFRIVAARRRGRQISWAKAALQTLQRHPRRVGGFIVHLGLAALILGFVGSGFGLQDTLEMKVGEPVSLGAYELQITELYQRYDPEKVRTYAKVQVLRDGQVLTEVEPGRYYFHAAESGTSEVDLRSTPLEDIYLAVASYDLTQQKAGILVVVTPFVWWIWIGGLIMVVGGVLCMSIGGRLLRPQEES